MTSGGIQAGSWSRLSGSGVLVPLGLAYLNQVLREDSIDTVFQDVNEAVGWRLQPSTPSLQISVFLRMTGILWSGPGIDVWMFRDDIRLGVSDAIRTDV